MSFVAPLSVREWGSGDRTAILLHGQLGSSEGWAEVAPLMAACSYRVLAVDLPGHGQSPPDPDATVESVRAQIEAVGDGAEVAIGHSLGGLLLAHSVESLGVERTIFVDSPLRYDLGTSVDEYRSRLCAVKAARTIEWLRARRPEWSEAACVSEAKAAEQFDIETSVSLMRSLSETPAVSSLPDQSMVVVPRPSDQLTVADLDELRRSGVRVEEIQGAGHTVWFGHLSAFMAAIRPWL